MSIPQHIKDLANQVRNEIYGKDVRESIAKSMEATAEVAEWSRQVAQDIVDGKFDEGELATEIERKLNELEAQYAPKLTTIQNEVENARGNDTSLGGRLNSISRDLAQTTQRTRKEMNTSLHTIKRRRPLFLFQDDDGQKQVLDTWLPLLKEKNFKLDIAVITSYPDNNPSFLTWDELKNLKNNYNVDIVNHSDTHPDLNTLTEGALRKEFETSISKLYKHGFHSGNILVYPRGVSDHNVRTIASEYFRGAVFDGGGLNYPPLYTYNLRRVNLFSGTDNMQDIETLKGHVDTAFENNGCLIFMSHSQFSGFNKSTVSELIDYINYRGGEWAHTSEALDRVGNAIHIGDNEDRYENGEPQSVSYPYKIIDVEGVTHSNYELSLRRVLTSVDYNTPVTDFPRGDITITDITNSNPTISLFPRGVGGTLETYHSYSVTASYQEYKPNNINQTYKRRWIGSGWSAFERVGSDIEYEGEHTFHTPPSAFTHNKTTITAITTSNSEGFPENVGGLLITHRYAGFAYTYQTYKPNASTKLYIRYSNGEGTDWSSFALSGS